MSLSEKDISDRLSFIIQSGRKSEPITRKDIYQYRCAAVLLPLFWEEGTWHLLFTHRTEMVENHKGQVSFPGGVCEGTDKIPQQTAVREAEEEIGLSAKDVRVLGVLQEVTTITGYRITPVIGVIPRQYSFQPAPAEVSRVFSVPLDWLSNRENWDEKKTISDLGSGNSHLINYHEYQGEIIWGITAQISQNFLKALGLIKK